MKKIILITALGSLVSSIAFATTAPTNTQSSLVNSWNSTGAGDIVTISNPSAVWQNVIVSVSLYGSQSGSPINLICNGKNVTVAPYSGVTCRTNSDVSWSSTANGSSGQWSVDFSK